MLPQLNAVAGRERSQGGGFEKPTQFREYAGRIAVVLQELGGAVHARCRVRVDLVVPVDEEPLDDGRPVGVGPPLRVRAEQQLATS
ncbi:hypothetical protein ACTMTU_25090 [Streptomyces sp. OZ13]|uniref:hypothetical protein n=1 Tax=Streptomyces sp. OZ13 TaxID=3452210 RepID=UPI003F88B19E